MDNPHDDPYLSREALDNLRFYRYSAVDKSPLTKYGWDHAATYFPTWMAPNLITLSDYHFVACIALYQTDLETPGPTWLYLSFALGLFLYQTLIVDVDGRQARKTGTSSALGGLVQVASLGLGHSVNGAFYVLIGCVPMWLGTLYLGYINGPTEGILIAIGVHLISAFFGPRIWHTTVDLSGLISWISRPVTLIECFNVIVLLAVFVVHAPVCFMNVHAACKSKGISFTSAISQNLIFVAYIGSCWVWINSPYSSLVSHTTGSVSHGGLIEFTLLVVCTFGRMLPRVIIAHLTHGPFPTLLPSVIFPILGGVSIVNLNWWW
ncbi:hypothetical protein B0J17DRAFT_654717 [Rhizoctonia solani]|nr:hypothetical protein B0J17DRAFT_654717 [Rhizoctonia solani]